MLMRYRVPLALLVGLLCSGGARAQSAAPSPADGGLGERIAAVKRSLAQSQKSLRAYQWVETTTVSLKGEVKSTTQSTCYYGADGVLEKVPLSASPPPATKRGLKGKIIENKKEELSDTMKQAVALVKTYVPPQPELLQRSKDAGKAAMDVLQPGKLIRLVFRDYQLPGDTLGVMVDLSTNRLAGINVSSYLSQPNNPVSLDVKMGTLADGTVYPANIQLAVKSQELAVAVTNAGYRPLQQ